MEPTLSPLGPWGDRDPASPGGDTQGLGDTPVTRAHPRRHTRGRRPARRGQAPGGRGKEPLAPVLGWPESARFASDLRERPGQKSRGEWGHTHTNRNDSVRPKS